MSQTPSDLSPSEAARRLGVSIKALRVYERHGLVTPRRDATGWRSYGPDDMKRLRTIVTLRDLGFSLARARQALEGGPSGLEAALAAHQAALEDQQRQTERTIGRIRGLRATLTRAPDRPAHRIDPPKRPVSLSFGLPWPWDGEVFDLRDISRITYITGPLGSGKTRFARAIAEHLPGAAFIGMERNDDDGVAMCGRMDADRDLAEAVRRLTARLVADGATESPALTTLLATLADSGDGALVIDLVEHRLDRATQGALMRYLRSDPGPAALFLLTRSLSILDMRRIGFDETILYCPANHSPPLTVAPDPDAFGYEAVMTCLATPEVRARTEGMTAVRPEASTRATTQLSHSA